MFGFLKDKLKKALSAFSSGAKEEVVEEKMAAPAEAPKKETAPKKPEAKATPPVTHSQPKKSPEEKPAKKVPEKQAAKETTVPAEIPAPKETPKAAVPDRIPEKKVSDVPKKTLERTEEPRARSHAPAPKPVPSHPTPKPHVPEHPTISPVIVKAEPPAPKEEAIPAKTEEKSFLKRIFGKKEETKREAAPAAIAPAPRPQPEVPPQEPGFFGKISEAFTKKTLSPEKFEELFFELEVAMLENSVAVEVIEKIKADLKEELTTGKVSRLGVDEMIAARLRSSIEELFAVDGFDLVERIKAGPRPFKVCVIGVNGSGKTTTLAKIVKLLQNNKLSCVVAASDTFRAAAIDQLKQHTDKLGVKLISQGYGADPAAVAFDAIEHAKARGIDVVLIDTAGRLHSNTNLMAELEKVVRVSKPDLKLFVGEAITGNDCVEQAKVFDSLVGIDAIILSKADVDEKGGAAISVSYVTKKPILYLGTGQTYDDLEPFDKEKVIGAMGL